MTGGRTTARQLLRLEEADGRLRFAELDGESCGRLRAELAEWLRAEPHACPPGVRAELLAMVAGPDPGADGGPASPAPCAEAAA